jgi:acetolactate synthase-1/2/3 large subunit|tara:strand:- start:5665 stop:7374 length:1710 start_codon:yes stop_codon:yes gene_type:complete
MKVAEFVTNFLIEHGIQKCFSVTGGFAMHFNDSFGEKMDVTYTHGEQPAGYAALGWSSYEHNPSVCCVTSGCGATNAVTPCLIAYQDSVPVFFISGQVHRDDNIRAYGGKIRGYFGSDCDIVESVKTMTKYAVELTNPKDTLRVLQECFHNLTTGRLGPVWLSVPVDVQSMQVPDVLEEWSPPQEVLMTSLPQEFLDVWSNSKRPIVLAGNGIHLSKTKEKFKKFLDRHRLPYVVSFFGSDLGDDYTGKTGLIGNRAGNFAIQNADLILCLGSRLSKSITGYNRALFGREAKVVYLDIDTSEFIPEKKLDIQLHMDLKTFFNLELPPITPDTTWISKNKEWKDLWEEELPERSGPLVCPYRHLNTFFKEKPGNVVVTMSSGSIYCVGWHMHRYKEGDRFITSGHGDMGYEIAAAMGASLHGKRTYVIVGDGSFQYNIQDLQTLKHHNMPVTILVFNNDGYGAIKITQEAVFKREYGTSSKSDITFCDIEKISKAYTIPYHRVERDEDVSYLSHQSGPMIVEIPCNVQGRYPRLSNKPLPDGTFKNMPYEEMAPFLDDAFLKDNLFVERV